MRCNSPLPRRRDKFGSDRIDVVDMTIEHKVEAVAFHRIGVEAVEGGDDNRQFSGHVSQVITDIVDVHFKRHFL